MLRSFVVFLAWGVIGFIASFALLYGFTPVGPVILLTVWLGYRFLPRVGGSSRPEAFGALAGFGAFWVFIATTVDDGAAVFAVVGLVAVAAGVLSYLLAGRARCTTGAATG